MPALLERYLLDIQPGYARDPVRGVYNHGWLIGDEAAISQAVQARIDDPPPDRPRGPGSDAAVRARQAEAEAEAEAQSAAPPSPRRRTRTRRRPSERSRAPKPPHAGPPGHRRGRAPSSPERRRRTSRSSCATASPPLIRGLDPDHPARLEGEREIARLERIAYVGEVRGQPGEDGERPLPSLHLP